MGNKADVEGDASVDQGRSHEDGEEEESKKLHFESVREVDLW